MTQQRLGPSGGRPLWLRRFLSLRSVQLMAAPTSAPTSACGKHRPQVICGDYELPEVFIDALELLLE